MSTGKRRKPTATHSDTERHIATQRETETGGKTQTAAFGGWAEGGGGGGVPDRDVGGCFMIVLSWKYFAYNVVCSVALINTRRVSGLLARCWRASQQSRSESNDRSWTSSMMMCVIDANAAG
jgi:hypothetical protein